MDRHGQVTHTLSHQTKDRFTGNPSGRHRFTLTQQRQRTQTQGSIFASISLKNQFSKHKWLIERVNWTCMTFISFYIFLSTYLSWNLYAINFKFNFCVLFLSCMMLWILLQGDFLTLIFCSLLQSMILIRCV